MEADPIEHFRHLSRTLEGADNRRNIAVETHFADASLALFEAPHRIMDLNHRNGKEIWREKWKKIQNLRHTYC